VGLDLRNWEYLVGTYVSYPSIFPLHLGGFVPICTRMWWATSLHGNSPLAPTPPNNEAKCL
jgi:hypothetical protein